MALYRVFCSDCGGRTVGASDYPEKCGGCDSINLKTHRTTPGRYGEVSGLCVLNGQGQPSGDWYVRFGSAMHPDYADPDFGGDFQGGHLLTPDQADELAEHLRSAANWARAQNYMGARV